MADPRGFDIDKAEDFDDGTQATSYLNRDSDSDLDVHHVDHDRSLTRSTRARASRSAKSSTSAPRASALRIKNWSAKEFEGAAYAGKVVKRKEISPQEDQADGFSSPDEDAMNEWSDAEPFADSDDDQDQDRRQQDETEKEDMEEEEEEEEEEDHEDDHDDDDAEKLIREFQQEDASTQLLSTKDSTKFYEKSIHVRHQKLIWEKCLELQIFTKRFLMSCKTLVDATDTTKNAKSSSSQPTPAAPAATAPQAQMDQVLDQLHECIQAISSVQDRLCNLPSLTKPPAPHDSPNKKRKRQDPQLLWQSLQQADAHVLPQYNDILNEILRQNAFTSSQTKKFKAVNQDILSQVDAVLADRDRVKRKAHAPLAEAKLLAGQHNNNDDDDDDDVNALDELMYDDTDFYQQLLKEFIESGAHGDQFSLSMLRKKKKKHVNRKASKGRQLRYVVHPKLENFMFPDPYPKPELDVDELFKSIFGGNQTPMR